VHHAFSAVAQLVAFRRCRSAHWLQPTCPSCGRAPFTGAGRKTTSRANLMAVSQASTLRATCMACCMLGCRLAGCRRLCLKTCLARIQLQSCELLSWHAWAQGAASHAWLSRISYSPLWPAVRPQPHALLGVCMRLMHFGCLHAPHALWVFACASCTLGVCMRLMHFGCLHAPQGCVLNYRACWTWIDRIYSGTIRDFGRELGELKASIYLLILQGLLLLLLMRWPMPWRPWH
jgi:hypothetical protein